MISQVISDISEEYGAPVMVSVVVWEVHGSGSMNRSMVSHKFNIRDKEEQRKRM